VFWDFRNGGLGRPLEGLHRMNDHKPKPI